MQPELPPYRPPSEAQSILIRVTRGCAWNRCAFCAMYKGERFSLRTVEEIENDLMIMAKWDGFQTPGRPIFLADSDTLVHPRLPDVVRAVRAHFPAAGRMTTYCRLHTLWRRTPQFLRELRDAGLDRLHAGMESGSAEILERMRKGIDPERAVKGARHALDAGFELSLYYLSAMGGEEHWEAHARESARVITAAPPHFLRVRSLVVLPGTPLHEERAAMEFTPASPLTRLREMRLLVQELCEGLRERGNEAELEICSDHFSNYIWADGEMIFGGVNGYLPADQDLLLGMLDECIAAAASRRLVDPASLAAGGRILSL
ncbi:MAG: radical SAM protein [Candidatus Eisenbacteria bacterium]|nr:radical SAM protein [Candidatus Eisenbacteria bacterium]